VIDSTPPVITLNAKHHQPVGAQSSIRDGDLADLVSGASDNCDASVSVASVYITQVTSDEVENGNGDGNTLNDIVIAADCHSVQLRAERDGSQNGRVYRIMLKLSDGSGNVTTAIAKVSVPKNQNGNPAIDDGAQYVVNGCP
jgi:hypothetical protein